VSGPIPESGAGEPLDAFFARALARNPDRRFPSARAFAAAFGAAARGEAATESPPLEPPPSSAEADTLPSGAGVEDTVATGDDTLTATTTPGGAPRRRALTVGVGVAAVTLVAVLAIVRLTADRGTPDASSEPVIPAPRNDSPVAPAAARAEATTPPGRTTDPSATTTGAAGVPPPSASASSSPPPRVRSSARAPAPQETRDTILGY
jgi:serine/threonine-protein kinase